MASVLTKNKSIEEIKVRDVNYEEAKSEVLDYYRSYKEAYPHEVADDLELDYDLVWQVTEELKKKRRLEVIEAQSTKHKG